MRDPDTFRNFHLGMMAIFFLSWDLRPPFFFYLWDTPLTVLTVLTVLTHSHVIHVISSSHRWQVLSSTQAFEILAEFNVQDEYATEATTTVIIHTRSFGLNADVDGLVWGAYFCLLSRFVADKKTYIYITSELLVKIHTASVTQPFFASTCELGPTLPPQKWWPFMAQDRPKRRLSPWTRRSCADCINSNYGKLEEQKLGFNLKQPRVYLVSPPVGGEMVVKVARRKVLWGCHYQTLGYWSLTYKK